MNRRNLIAGAGTAAIAAPSSAAAAQDDLRDLCRALGMFDGARPLSPHQVFRECLTRVEGLRDALERVALLDEADGHELTRDHAMRAVAIATSTLGKHPSEILAARKPISGR